MSSGRAGHRRQPIAGPASPIKAGLRTRRRAARAAPPEWRGTSRVPSSRLTAAAAWARPAPRPTRRAPSTPRPSAPRALRARGPGIDRRVLTSLLSRGWRGDASGGGGRGKTRRRRGGPGGPTSCRTSSMAPICLLLLAICFYPSLYAVRLALTDASLLRLRANAVHRSPERGPAGGRSHLPRRGSGGRCAGTSWWSWASSPWRLPIALFLNRALPRARRRCVRPCWCPTWSRRRSPRCCGSTCSTGTSASRTTSWSGSALIEHYVPWLEPSRRELRGRRGRHGLGRAAADGGGPPRRAADDSRRALRGLERRRGQRLWSGSGTSPCRISCRPSCFILLLRTIWMSNHIDLIFISDARRSGLQQLHRGGLQLHADQPVRDRLLVDGGGGARPPCWSPRRRSTCGASPGRCWRDAGASERRVGTGRSGPGRSSSSPSAPLSVDLRRVHHARGEGGPGRSPGSASAPSSTSRASRRCRTTSTCSGTWRSSRTSGTAPSWRPGRCS